MDKRVIVFGLFSLTTLAGSVISSGCSSTTTVVNPGDAGPTSEGGAGKGDGGGGGGGGGSKDGGGGGGGGDPDEACAKEATKIACFTCCATNHKSGYEALLGASVDCACDGTGAVGGMPACDTECAKTLCAATPAQPDATCNACVQASLAQGGACAQAVSTACSAVPDCVEQQQCAQACPP